MAILGLIPARTNSGLGGKNLRRLVDGSTLLSRAIAVSREVFGDDTIVSTDGDDVADEARRLGAGVLRRKVSGDGPMLAVVEEVARFFPHAAWIALLQPTSPLRTAAPVREVVTRVLDRDRIAKVNPTSAVSVSRARYGPDHLVERQAIGLVPFRGWWPETRHTVDDYYVRDGWLYLFNRATVLKRADLFGECVYPIITPPTESLNVDAEDDWILLNAKLERLAAVEQHPA
jgi:CMP-N-acetylneuraminic acid synthetase